MAKKSTPKKKPAAKTKKPTQKRGLGRGLSALMDDVSLSAFTSDDVVPAEDNSKTEETPVVKTPKETKSLVSTPTESAFETKSADEHDPYDISDYANRTDEQRAESEAIIAAEIARFRAENDIGEDTRKSAPPADHNIKGGVTFVEMGQLERNPEQPRRMFDSELLLELANSIRQKGILQPILVRPVPSGELYRGKPAYQVVAGERRWQAATMARLESMPVFIREITDQEALEIGVIENVQRAELNPMEEAMAYKALTSQFGRTQEDVAEAVGKSRSYIANMMRLINLPEKVQDYLARGDISTGHARAIIAAPDPTEMADAIVENNLTVRDAEDWARKLKNKITEPVKFQAKMKGADERRLEASLMDALGLSVDLKHRGPGGELRIKYKTDDQLDELVLRLSGRG